MTVKTDPASGNKYIAWEPGDEIDWTTPNSEWHAHEFCGNCGWDAPGCGCPRDCPQCVERQAYCGHDDPDPSDGDYDDPDEDGS